MTPEPTKKDELCKPLCIQLNSSSKRISQVGKKDTTWRIVFFSPWHWCGMSRPFFDVPNDWQICSKSQGTIATKGTWLKKISHSTGIWDWNSGNCIIFVRGWVFSPENSAKKSQRDDVSCVMFLFHLVFGSLTFRTDHRNEDQHNFGLKWCVYSWGTHIAHSHSVSPLGYDPGKPTTYKASKQMQFSFSTITTSTLHNQFCMDVSLVK